MKRIALFACTLAVFTVACSQTEPPAPPPKKVEAKPAEAKPVPKLDAAPAAASKKDAVADDFNPYLARKLAEQKLAKELAEEEDNRLLAYDKDKVPKHLALLAFQKKIRAELDAAAAKLKGKPTAGAEMEKLVNKQRKSLEAQAKVLKSIDPKGGNSNLVTDHDVVLNALATDYPGALIDACAGDEGPLKEVTAEIEKRHAKMVAWIERAKSFKKK